MSKSINNKLVLVLALGLFAFSGMPAASRRPPSADRKNAFTITRDILKAFYPHVFGNERYFSVSTGQPVDDDQWGEFSSFRFKVTPFSPGVSLNPTYDASMGKLAPEPENTTFLEGRTWVGRDGEIISFFVSGELACTSQNDAIHRLVESHPEWSESQAIHALKEAGARYGPAERERFLESLHLDKIEKSLGRLKIVSVEFTHLGADHEGSFSVAALDWAVDAEGELADRSRIEYTLWFEPFQGKLIHIHRKGAPAG